MAAPARQFYAQVSAAVRKGTVAPAYLMYGEETYLMDALIDQITTAVVGRPEKEMNVYIRYAPDHALDDVLALTAGSSLFSEKKVVVYKDFQNARNPNTDRLVRYLKNPSPDICLIVVVRLDSINQARYQALAKHMEVVHLLPLRERELHQFVTEEFGKYRLTVASEAVQALVYLVGEKIHDLKTEIAQVANRFSDKERISAEDVEAVVGVYVNQNVFELTRLIAARQLEKSLFLLHNLLERGENPGSILFMLLRHLTYLWKIRGYYQTGEKNQRTIQEKLRIYSRQFQQYQAELPRWKMSELARAMQLLQQADTALKSGGRDPEVVMDTLILKLIHPV